MNTGKVRNRCRDCKEPPAPDRARCQKHLDYHREHRKRYKGIRREKKVAGICYDCNLSAVRGKTRCKDHLNRNKKGVTRYLKSEKGSYYLETSVEQRRAWQRAAAKKCRRGNGRYRYVVNNSRAAGKNWDLSRTVYEDLISQPCYYCGLPNNVEAGIGLDRIDNQRGYELDNVVSCCIECNIARGDRFSVAEMKLIGRAIRQVKEARE